MHTEPDATATSDRLLHLAAAVGAPEFIVPWLDRFYDPFEANLVLEAAAGMLPGDHSGLILTRAQRRAVIDDVEGRLVPADFHARYEIWALFDDWRDIPPEIRAQLNEWELDDYLAEVGDGIAKVRDGGADGDQQDYAYLLLNEAEELIRQAPAIYLWPCNCRAMWGNCDKSQTVCLRFGNEREIGWELSKDRAIEILRQADHEGLMHTAYLTSLHGHHGICNCCSDCCFPIIAGERLGAADVWPRRRFVAAADPELCTLCARCVRRCPFGAISLDRRRKPALQIDAAACRGCGLCATGCPATAVAMLPRSDAVHGSPALTRP